MKKFFIPPTTTSRTAVALVLLRLVAGLGLMLHGYPKIQNPLGWRGVDSMTPDFLQALAALAEFGGGIAWMLGLFTPLASLGILCTMATAVWTHLSMGHHFVGKGGPYELAAVYLTISVCLLIAGPGRISADKILFRPKKSLFGRF